MLSRIFRFLVRWGDNSTEEMSFKKTQTGYTPYWGGMSVAKSSRQSGRVTSGGVQHGSTEHMSHHTRPHRGGH